MTTVRISGTVMSGKGVGAGFTRTDWALGIFESEFDIDPYPGTLNLRVSKTSLAGWRSVAAKGKRFAAPSKDWCDAKCFAVQIEHGHNHIAGAIVLPMVEGYPPDQVEIVASENLRSFFALDDGDLVTLHIQP